MRNILIFLVSWRSAMNLARAQTLAETKRKSGSVWRNAWAKGPHNQCEGPCCAARSRGPPLDLRNLKLQPWAGVCNAHVKDDLERRLSIMVCAGDATLNGARHEIATDWRAAYKKWTDPKGCE
jgi:hypothetical protein